MGTDPRHHQTAVHVIPAKWCPACDRIAELDRITEDATNATPTVSPWVRRAQRNELPSKVYAPSTVGPDDDGTILTFDR